MEIAQNDLIKDLTKRTEGAIAAVEAFKNAPLPSLNYKKQDKTWSALECIEHLNRYSAFYLPEIKDRLKKGAKSTASETFKSGWLGNYFANSVANKPKLNKMKTFAEMNPLGSNLSIQVMDQFLADQRELLMILEECKRINLTKTKTAISISKLIKLRLGDTLRVVIYHNERHIAQAQRAIRKV